MGKFARHRGRISIKRHILGLNVDSSNDTLKHKIMKLIKPAIVLVLTFFTVGICYARQPMTTMDLLTSKTWKAIIRFSEDREENDNDTLFSLYGMFNENEKVEILISRHNGINRYVSHYPYYLSNHKETKKFKESKVGKNKNGRYIILSERGKVFCFLIKKLTDDELILFYRNKPPEGVIGFKSTRKFYSVDKEEINFIPDQD